MDTHANAQTRWKQNLIAFLSLMFVEKILKTQFPNIYIYKTNLIGRLYYNLWMYLLAIFLQSLMHIMAKQWLPSFREHNPRAAFRNRTAIFQLGYRWFYSKIPKAAAINKPSEAQSAYVSTGSKIKGFPIAPNGFLFTPFIVKKDKGG